MFFGLVIVFVKFRNVCLVNFAGRVCWLEFRTNYFV